MLMSRRTVGRPTAIGSLNPTELDHPAQQVGLKSRLGRLATRAFSHFLTSATCESMLLNGSAGSTLGVFRGAG